MLVRILRDVGGACLDQDPTKQRGTRQHDLAPVQDTCPVRDCLANPIPVTTDLVVLD